MTEQTATDSAPSAEERLAALYTAPDEDTASTKADLQPEDEDEGEVEVVEDEVEADTDDSEEAEDGQTEDEEDEADTEEESDESDDDDKAEQLVEIEGETLTLEEVKLGYKGQDRTPLRTCSFSSCD